MKYFQFFFSERLTSQKLPLYLLSESRNISGLGLETKTIMSAIQQLESEMQMHFDRINSLSVAIANMFLFGKDGSQEYALACQQKEEAVNALDLARRQRDAWKQDRDNN